MDAFEWKLPEQHVERVTAPYEDPRAVEFGPALPKTVSGKIRRVELRCGAAAAAPTASEASDR